MIGKLAVLILIPGLAVAGDRPAPDELDCVFQPGERRPRSLAVDPSGDRPVTLTHDFGDGKGPVPAHQHSKGGGWVADTALVAASVVVDQLSTVSDTAQVGGNAQILGGAKVMGSAKVSESVVSGLVSIKDSAVTTSFVMSRENGPEVEISGNAVSILNSVVQGSVYGVYINANAPVESVIIDNAYVGGVQGRIVLAMMPQEWEIGDGYSCNLSGWEAVTSPDQVSVACQDQGSGPLRDPAP